MRSVTLDQQTYQLPENWGEVDSERLPRLIQLVYLTPESPAMYHELIQVALNIRPRVWKRLMRKHFAPNLSEPQRTANAAALQQLLNELRWIWTQPMEKQPFDSLTVMGTRWLLPQAGFQTITYGELTDAYIHFIVFLRQLVPGDKHLDLLVATLCRPERPGNYTADKTWNGDCREEYNEFITQDRAAIFSLVPYAQRMAVLLYFAASFKTLMNRYAVFADDAQQDVQAEAYPGQSMLKNQHLLAEKHIFGNIAQTKTSNAHEVLLFLEEHRKDLLAQLERQKQHESN